MSMSMSLLSSRGGDVAAGGGAAAAAAVKSESESNGPRKGNVARSYWRHWEGRC